MARPTYPPEYLAFLDALKRGDTDTDVSAKWVRRLIRENKRRSRAGAIRLKCLECCCENEKEVRDCHLMGCALWPYRMG